MSFFISPHLFSSLLISLSHFSNLPIPLSSSGFGKEEREGKRKEREGGTQRGRGEERRKKQKRRPTSRSCPPPGGGPLRSNWQKSPPLCSLGGDLRQLLAGSPRRGGASPDRTPENWAIPKKMQCWKSVKQNTGKIGLFFAKSGGPYRSWKSQDDLVQKFSPFLVPPWDFWDLQLSTDFVCPNISIFQQKLRGAD